MKEQNPTRKDESIKTDNEICEMCAKESEEPEKNIALECQITISGTHTLQV